MTLTHSIRAAVDTRSTDGRAPCPSADRVQVTDTTELRWFATGRLPADVLSWLARDGRAGHVERRCDSYRADRRPDAGVKRRFRETLELKVRVSVGGHLALAPGLAGRLETWRRWSPAEHLVDDAGDVPWVDVHKSLVRRRFRVGGEEAAASAAAGAPAGAGCDVEVGAVRIGEIDAWTFAFAAFGPLATRRTALVDAWRALVADRCPEPLVASLTTSCGYPAWLAAITSGVAETEAASWRDRPQG